MRGPLSLKGLSGFLRSSWESFSLLTVGLMKKCLSVMEFLLKYYPIVLLLWPVKISKKKQFFFCKFCNRLFDWPYPRPNEISREEKVTVRWGLWTGGIIRPSSLNCEWRVLQWDYVQFWLDLYKTWFQQDGDKLKTKPKKFRILRNLDPKIALQCSYFWGSS